MGTEPGAGRALRLFKRILRLARTGLSLVGRMDPETGWEHLETAEIFMKIKFPVMVELICIKTICVIHVNGLKIVLKLVFLTLKTWVLT